MVLCIHWKNVDENSTLKPTVKKQSQNTNELEILNINNWYNV